METSKKDSSARQLKAAIVHFHQGDLDCAITLAAAAEGILPHTDKPFLFRFMREKEPSEDFNTVINWLKHPGNGPEKIGIHEGHAVFMIMRAITKFMAVYEPETTEEFEEFIRWFRKAGYLPKG